jgi:NAD(P)-dependent dehydrogenase (short-subunit alcohol dehydrogenase family)
MDISGAASIYTGMNMAPSQRPAAAIVIGASGGIGAALVEALRAQEERWARVVPLHRRSTPPLDLLDEGTIESAAAHCRDEGLRSGYEVRWIIDATGILQGQGTKPEKTWSHIDARAMAASFVVNAIGPALLMKHFLPLLPRTGPAAFATLSAKVGSIGDNRLGGWYSYRASKAALNQLVRTAAVELTRSRPDAICCALHPGTVDTALSRPFARSGLNVRTPAEAARRLVSTIEQLQRAGSKSNGGFFDGNGDVLPW